MKMVPMGENLFRFAEIDYFRLKIVTDGTVTGIEGRYDDGTVDVSLRNDSDK